MKKTFCAALAFLPLMTMPVAVDANERLGQNDVTYVEALECSTVFTLLSTESAGQTAADYEELAARWLVIAMRRDGTPDGRLADAEFIPMMEDLVDVLNDVPDPAAADRFIDDMIGFCEAKEAEIAGEFYSIRV